MERGLRREEGKLLRRSHVSDRLPWGISGARWTHRRRGGSRQAGGAAVGSWVGGCRVLRRRVSYGRSQACCWPVVGTEKQEDPSHCARDPWAWLFLALGLSWASWDQHPVQPMLVLPPPASG